MLIAKEGIARGAGAHLRPRRGEAGHVCDDFGAGLEVVADEFGVGAVGDAEPHGDRLQLLVNVEPHPARRLWRHRQRGKERIDCRRRLWSAVFRLTDRGSGGGAAPASGLRDGGLERARVLAACLQPCEKLLLLVGIHGFESFEQLGGISAAAKATASSTSTLRASATALAVAAPSTTKAKAPAAALAVAAASSVPALRTILRCVCLRRCRHRRRSGRSRR